MKNPILLGVNIDHVATVREARGERYPDPVATALVAEQAGADGITAHLREDMRHIQPRDIEVLKEVLQTRLNLEMAVTNDMICFARRVKPHYCCLVPEKREELTTEGGLDVMSHFSKIKEACSELDTNGIIVSLFIDPNERQIEAARETGASTIELHTGEYACAQNERERDLRLDDLRRAASFASRIGLQVNAGHGLHYRNVSAIAQIPQIIELNIGHSIVAQALMDGFEKAVSKMKALMVQGRALC